MAFDLATKHILSQNYWTGMEAVFMLSNIPAELYQNWNDEIEGIIKEGFVDYQRIKELWLTTDHEFGLRVRVNDHEGNVDALRSKYKKTHIALWAVYNEIKPRWWREAIKLKYIKLPQQSKLIVKRKVQSKQSDIILNTIQEIGIDPLNMQKKDKQKIMDACLKKISSRVFTYRWYQLKACGKIRWSDATMYNMSHIRPIEILDEKLKAAVTGEKLNKWIKKLD